MKKLMIALAVAACAVAVNAASFTWSATGTNTAKTFYGVDGNTIAGMTVYLLDAATVSQDALLTALRGGGAISDYTAVGSQALDGNSRIVSTQVSYGEAPNAYTFYMAIVDGDNLFLSAGVSSTAQASSVSAINFSGVKAATQTVFADADTAYGSAGWYSTAAAAPIPEPTSGLLMLLGMAGLALRRRRA